LSSYPGSIGAAVNDYRPIGYDGNMNAFEYGGAPADFACRLGGG
jgi:hypothetical protein